MVGIRHRCIPKSALPNKGNLPKKSRGCPKSPTVAQKVGHGILRQGGAVLLILIGMLVSAFADFEKRENSARDIVRDNDNAPIVKMQRGVGVNVSIFDISAHQDVFSFGLGFDCILDNERFSQLRDEGTRFNDSALGFPCGQRNGWAIGFFKVLSPSGDIKRFNVEHPTKIFGSGASTVGPSWAYTKYGELFSSLNQFSTLARSNDLRPLLSHIGTLLGDSEQSLVFHLLQLPLHGGQLLAKNFRVMDRYGDRRDGSESNKERRSRSNDDVPFIPSILLGAILFGVGMFFGCHLLVSSNKSPLRIAFALLAFGGGAYLFAHGITVLINILAPATNSPRTTISAATSSPCFR